MDGANENLNIEGAGTDSNRTPTVMMQLVLMSLAALEGADNQLLGASLKYTQQDLGIGFAEITQMSVVQGICANLCAPIWGVLADRRIFRQKDLMIVAALGQGLITVLLAFATEYGWFMLILRGFNGAFLAGLRPIANGVVASHTSSSRQGEVFSRILAAILLGGALCGLVVTPLSGVPMCLPFFGLQNGWRVAWASVGGTACLVAFFTSVGIDEEPASTTPVDLKAALAEEAGLFAGFLCMPSFIAMVVQGIFGTIPWTVLWLGTRYYQLAGITDVEAGLLAFLNPIGGLIGVVLGGYLSDMLVHKFGFNGRPLTAQLTVALGVPIMYMNFYGIEPGDGSFWIYFFVNFAFGVLANWAQGGCNWPVLASIVPESTRSRVLALEGAMENSLANFLGPVFVSYIAQNVFGFDFVGISGGANSFAAARALGSALTVVVCFPWLVCFLVYSTLHWAVPRDIKRAQAREQQAMDKEQSRTYVAFLSKSGSILNSGMGR